MTDRKYRKNDKERIFNRFYSARKEDNEMHSGLGLAIVKTITKNYKGKVSARNTGNGVIFTVSLPAV